MFTKNRIEAIKNLSEKELFLHSKNKQHVEKHKVETKKYIDDMKLVDFKVRITDGGTEAVTRVIIDCEDGEGKRWSTVGVSANIVDASFEALLDAIQWKLVRDGAPSL